MFVAKEGEWCVITVPPTWHEKSVEEVLVTEIGVPKKILHQLRMEKGVKVNGEIIPWREKVQVEDSFAIQILKEESTDVLADNVPITVCYEDEMVLVVNKPYGMDTHPNQKGERGTLLNAVVGYVQQKGENCPVRHIHRLDKDTTGGVVFAKYPLAGAIMDQMLANKAISRQYVALVQGIVQKDSDTIVAKIGRDRHHATRRRVSPQGDHAVTHYRVVKRFPKNKLTLVALTLETGRTHQIRVHMSYLGHPLVGDTLYGGRTSLLQRQALHGETIILHHPLSKEILEVTVPFPNDIKKVIQQLQ